MQDQAVNELPWTGERLVPSCHGQVLYEHLHRYAVAVALAKDKRVLDIASGEGYGSNLLAAVSLQVIGVDIDADVVRHAQHAYPKENLAFMQGSCLEIPVEDHSIDLVVSFETIEHISDQEQFLREIKRVLTADGTLIVSSPDKREYTDRTGKQNPFHRSELYHQDFSRLLARYFKTCRIGKQRLIAGSWIAPDEPSPDDAFGTFSGDIHSVDFEIGVRSGVYSIAFCSDARLPKFKLGVFENRRESEGIWNLLERYVNPESLQQAITAQSDLVAQLRTESGNKSRLLDYAAQIREAQQKLIAELGGQVRNARDRLVQANHDLARAKARVGQLTSELNRQFWATKKLGRLLDDAGDAARRLRSSRRWRIANPFAALKAATRNKPSLLGYGHLDRVVSAYSELRSTHDEIREVDRAIELLKNPSIGGAALLHATDEAARQFQPRVPLRPIKFPVFQAVDLSIIIPVFNQLRFTQACLASIQDHQDDQRFEIIVVDDCSTDGSAEALAKLPGIHYLRNDKNLGFIGSCNAGAKRARGNYLIFLNNDTTVTDGWLSELRETFRFEPEAGLVGSKLVYPDGRLQEAGGIIWRDGSGWNRGKYEDPDKPEFNFLREVDYCSAACLMIPKALFEKVGGFDPKYFPAYYEDTDLAFKVRRAGLRVFYQPLSKVIHYEGITGGTDISAGVKRHQETNRSIFATTWSETLASKPLSEDVKSLAVLKHGAKRILIIDHHLPMPDRDSGSLRMFQILKILHRLGHRITFIPDNLYDVPPYGDDLRRRGIEVVCQPNLTSISEYLEVHGDRLDVVILSRCDIANKHIRQVCLHAPRSRVIFDTVDLHFLRAQREAALSNNIHGRLLACEKQKQEYDLINEADETWVVSPSEQQLLRHDHPERPIEVVSNIVDIHGSATPFSLRRDFLFIGSFQHSPNIDAVLFFTHEIYPLVSDSLPGVKFYIIGDKAPPEILVLASKDIIVTGFQSDVQPYFETVRLSVAPLRFGAGVKGKINQSMSFGVPVVATSLAVEGMCLKHGEDVLIADKPDQFASAVVQLYQCEDLWQHLSQNCLEKTNCLYSVETATRQLVRLFSESHIGRTISSEMLGHEQELSFR